MESVRTRFAPSPTGYMHIGGMRTALFNWLWARHNNGTFLLRIDDTDQTRNLDDALDPILHAFRWLGLDWDEGPEVGGPYEPYFQSQRGPRYTELISQLLDNGSAYRDFDTPEQIQEDRQAAEREGQPYVGLRRSLELDDGTRDDYLAEGRPFVVRLLVPRDERIELEDDVRGHVEWDGALIPDPVLVRNDGSPLYNFASAVDDADMKISHVIRAEEHLSNCPIQLLIHRALGNDQPRFAHIPFVSAPGSKEKLSKREKKLERYRKNAQFQKLFQMADAVFPRIGLSDSMTINPVMVEYYERMGFLPVAVLNALARLGWSLDDKTEILSLESVVQSFTLDRVIKSPAGLDPDKLLSFQAHWMNELPREDKLNGCRRFLSDAGMLDTDEDGLVEHVVEAAGDRVKLFSDILQFDEFFVADQDMTFDEKAFNKRLRKPEDARRLLETYRQRLADTSATSAADLEADFKSFVEEQGIKIGQIIHAVRVAVTGKGVGLGMFDCLAILGRDRCLNRIDRALEVLTAGGASGGPS